MKYPVIALISTAALLPIPFVSPVVYSSCANSGILTYFAMTFDDGPINSNTVTLLDALKAANVKVSFHFVSGYIQDSQVQAAMMRAKNDGHIVGIRFDTKYSTLVGLDSNTILNSLEKSANDIMSVIGVKPKFVRLPYKAYDANAISTIESAGYIVTDFSLDAGDYAATSNQTVILGNFRQAIESLGAGTKFPYISSQHDASFPSINGTADIITYVKAAGYNLVTLDKCIGAESAYGPVGKGTGSASGKSSSNANALAAWTGLALIGSTLLAVIFQFF